MSRAGLTREHVVRAAAARADDGGLRGLTVSALARDLGVRPPSLYSHVAGADDLLAGVATLALTELADRGDRALAGLAGRAALHALGEVHRTYAREHPGRWAAAGELDVPVTDDLAAAAARVAEQSCAVLRGYPVPEDERVHAVRLVASVVRGFVQLEAGGAFAGREPSSDRSWGVVRDRLDHALHTWPT